MKKSQKHYSINTDLGKLKLSETEIRRGYAETKRAWIEEFKKNYREQLNSSRRLNYMNALMVELRESLNDDRRFSRKLSSIIRQINQKEEEYMTSVILAYKTQGLDAALSEFEDIGVDYRPTDLRGKYKKKQLPIGKNLVREYEDILSQIKQKIKPRYSNPIAKRMDILELFPEIPKDKAKKLNIKNIKKSEIAFYVMAHRYNASPLTIRDSLTEARKFTKAFDLLMKPCQ